MGKRATPSPSVQPSTLRDATALAKTLSPSDVEALGRLARTPRQRDAVAAACIRALRSVGGPAALDAIATYAEPSDEWSDAVARELSAAWSAFDPRTFASRVFAGRPSLALFELDIERLDGLDDLDGLTDLSLAKAPALHDLSALARCRALAGVSIAVAPRLRDLSPIARDPSLSSLSLSHLDALRDEDFAALASAPSPSLVHLERLPLLSDLSPLAAMGVRHTLDLVQLPAVVDLSPLATMTVRGTVTLVGLSGARDLSPVVELIAKGATARIYDHDASMKPLGALLRERFGERAKIEPVRGLQGITTLRLASS